MKTNSKTTLKKTSRTSNKKSARKSSQSDVAANPPSDCSLCDRLAAFRRENVKKYPDWFNGAVPSFGPSDAQFLIVGLAPGLQGANKTARPFTGDYAGDLLYATLAKFGFSTGEYAASPDDGVELHGAMITNAVRCVPPQNKPIGAEITTCRSFLINQINALAELKVILCLGRIAHQSTVAAFGLRQKDAPFAHAARHEVPGRGITMIDSYHCSRYNTNTGRLTEDMFEQVFSDVMSALDR